MTRAKNLTSDLCKGHWPHLEAILRNKEFLPIAFDWKEIQTWGWSQCISLVETRRTICNMTYLGDLVTLTWGQILTLTFRGQKIYLSTRLGERNTMAPSPILYLSLFKHYSRKTFSQKMAILTDFDLWRLNRWPEVNFDKDVFERTA